MRRPRIAVLAAVLLFAGLGCGPPIPPPPAGNNPVIVGDSIVFGALIHGSMNRMPAAYFDADPGRGVRQGGFATHRDAYTAIPLALSHLTPGGWLVLEIGTNDLPAPMTSYRTMINDMLSQVPADVCVGFVTVADWSTPERQTNSVVWNDQLRDAARQRLCYRMIDWWENTRLRTFQILQPDLVHPNHQGEEELATMIQWNTA